MITKTERNMRSPANYSVNIYWPNGSLTSHKYNALWTKRKTLSQSGGRMGIKMKKKNSKLKDKVKIQLKKCE